jgi:hypothetical protein
MEKFKCPFCNKQIRAFTKKQMDYFILIHLYSRHRERIILEGIDKDG